MTAVAATRQGVRNLNGPNMDGTKHNGRSASCAHFRAPDLIPTVVRSNTELHSASLTLEIVYSTYCTGCGVKLFDNEAE